MATLRSLGLHMPAALQYLVAESVLHEDSTESDYTWDTYHDNSTDAHIDDVVTTEYHVVWSRGGVVRKCFNFEIEQERVIQALLTWFPVEEPTTSASQSSQSEVYTKTESQNSFLTQGTQPATDPNASPPRSPRVVEGRARALVVFLKTQAHVFFLSGSTHIVHLPFEVERAFPAARGVLLQRKRPPPHVAVPPSPPLPSAPPNSFLSNPQSFLAQSFSQSFSQSLSQPVHRHDRSLSSTRQTKPLKPGSANALFLQELAKSTALTSTDGLPRLFSFTDPLSELGLVVNVVPGERGGFLTTNSSGHRRLEPIDRDEEIIYVSPQNEIQFDRSGNDKPLLIVVTANYETNVFTIWSAAYLEPKSISASRKNHTSHSSNKVRRRSSYGPTVPGTGATTPAVRGSDRMRESFGGVIRNRLNPTSFSASSQPKERLSDEAVEEALASQLNPDSELSRQPKEHRRISGALSRAELSNSFDKSAFQDLATHRTSLGGSFNASFGASQRSRRSLGNDRLSFGGFPRPRNRASTPGSVTSRVSVGGASMDDTLEDIMDEDTLDTLEDYDELDDLFSPPDAGFEQEPLDGLRKELVLTPVAELSTEKYLRPELSSMRDSATSDQPTYKVFSVTAPLNSATLHERKLYIYIKHSSLRSPLQCEFAVSRKRLPAAATQSRLSSTPRYACAPRFVKTEELKDSSDLVKLVDGHVERVLCLTSSNPREPCLSLTAGWGTHLPLKLTLGLLRLFDPYAVLPNAQLRATAGRSRTLSPHRPLRCILSPGSAGTFDIIDGDLRRHRLQLQMSPADPFVKRLFQILSTVLPNYAGELLLEIWWNIHKSLSSTLDPQKNLDWAAFVTTLFTLAIPFIDDETVTPPKTAKSSQKRSSGRLSREARPDEVLENEDGAWLAMCARQDGRPQAKSWQSGPWAWVQQSRTSSSAMYPPSRRSSGHTSPSIAHQLSGKKDLLVLCAAHAREFAQTPIGKAANDHWRRLSSAEKQDLRISCLSETVVTLHLVREERKLDVLSPDFSTSEAGNLAPVLAQLGHWLKWEAWTWRQGSYYDLDGGLADTWQFEESSFKSSIRMHSQPWKPPPSILEWLCTVLRSQTYMPFPTLAILIRKSKASPHSSVNINEIIQMAAPRTAALHEFFADIDKLSNPRKAVEVLEHCGINAHMLATLPEAAKAPLMEALTRCQSNPPTTWPSSTLKLVRRDDLDLSLKPSNENDHEFQQNQSNALLGIQMSAPSNATQDVHSICKGLDREDAIQPLAEVDRHVVTRLIFEEDRRFMDAYQILEPLRQAVAEYRPDARLEDAAVFEAQKVLMTWVMVRTFSLPVGSSMIKYSSKKPLLTEKYPLYGFSTSCLMKPVNNVVSAERSHYTEEKYFWAFFNAGVSAGLAIARDAQGIDTSWILYNKPEELTNKHAGLLLGLGLNGHLKTIAKWLSFKYLTPKHTMTSVGLLLGLAASYMGTMDTLVTRLLSVHVTRMLPPGAAELNLSPYTQTTGLMGIGLLYYSTQHRRMSEVMLSEIEHVDEVDPSEPPDTLRDEAYRLAAGFALGFINIGKGRDLRGLHDMRIVERLMSVAVAPKPVNIAHILDQATAGAVVATALIFMKTHDEAVARKIDVPDTLPQFDYVRPDIFLLRTLAKHLIMWDDIVPDSDWVIKNLPLEYRSDYNLKSITKLRSDQMPFFNILAGLLWSVSLKYAGTGDARVRDFLVNYLDQFIRINRIPALRYDAKLARNTVRNCQDLVALSAATVMAGTGDLVVFRRLRALHGRLGPEIPYGSHLAGHMAMGALFMAGGTQTFSTSNKAIASLICAFYPIFPTDVQDSKAHLQAFRHFWVLAAEPRCLIVRDVDTGRAISMSVKVVLQDGVEKEMVAPCLLPELHTIERLETKDVAYWPTTLDFVNNELHLQHFRANQTMHVRRRTAHDMYASTFSATLVALNDAQISRTARLMWDWIFGLPSLVEFDKADLGLILPVDPHSSTFLETDGTIVDDRLALGRLAKSWKRSELLELRGVFDWAEMQAEQGNGRLRWLGRSVVEALKASVLERGRAMG